MRCELVLLCRVDLGASRPLLCSARLAASTTVFERCRLRPTKRQKAWFLYRSWTDVMLMHRRGQTTVPCCLQFVRHELHPVSRPPFSPEFDADIQLVRYYILYTLLPLCRSWEADTRARTCWSRHALEPECAHPGRCPFAVCARVPAALQLCLRVPTTHAWPHARHKRPSTPPLMPNQPFPLQLARR